MEIVDGPWAYSEIKNSILEIKIRSWRDFQSFVEEHRSRLRAFIWRGQRDAEWSLEPSFRRIKRKIKPYKLERSSHFHLRRFKKASIGIIDFGKLNSIQEERQRENELWAIGQHYNLNTPLLDWTFSPFVALYFAFESAEEPDSNYRSIFAFDALQVKKYNKQVIDEHEKFGLEIINPIYDGNKRIISQSGLHTRIPLMYTVEDWIKNVFPVELDVPVLIKIKFRSTPQRRKDCLHILNQMNINASSLFPDIYGVATRCNMAIELGGPGYFPIIGF